MRLAIVGSTKFTDAGADLIALQIIRHKLKVFAPELVISGGAEGVDTIAADAAHAMGLVVHEYLPLHERWAPEGYQDRNRKIATECTHLLALRNYRAKNNKWGESSPYGTYGSGWTADEAERLGKIVERIIL